MVMHAKSGGDIEVMGMMQGKIRGDTFYVMDAFALPVDASETRVNAAGDANEYLVDHIDDSEKVNRPENICDWSHSHPGWNARYLVLMLVLRVCIKGLRSHSWQ